MCIFNESSAYFLDLQQEICKSIGALEPVTRFVTDEWSKVKENEHDSGGGLTRVITNGSVFEKGGVNFSSVQGVLKPAFAKVLTGIETEQTVKATGISLVLHPLSPKVPTTHANLRYLEVGELAWFGGGMDLTPYYLYEEDAVHFHQVIKTACDKHNPKYYSDFKEECDRYFYLPHRKETRGIGGVFFDYLGRDGQANYSEIFNFVKELGDQWCEMYLPIVERRRTETYTPKERQFQLLRRGRYVEFNLLYDRGTKFGLETNGRIESILMSLPNIVCWDYNFSAVAGSPEAKLLEVLTNPRAWV